LQKPVTEVVDTAVARDVRAPAATKAPAAEIKKVNEKHRPEDVIVISSDETEKSTPVSRRVSRKGVKTLTSILSARSKVIG
jgi:cyclin B